MRLLAFVLLLVAVTSSFPGTRLVLDTPTLNQIAAKALSALQSSLPIHAGDFQISKKLLWVDCGVAVTNLTLVSLAVDPVSSRLTLDEPNWIAVDFVGDAEAEFGLELHVGFLKHTTTVAVAIDGLKLETTVAVNASAANKPQLAVGRFALELSDVKVQVGDEVRTTQLLQALLLAAKGLLLKELPSLANKFAGTAVASINSLLASLPLQVPFSGFLVDLSKSHTGLVGSPAVVNDDYLSIPLNATLLANGGAYPLFAPSETPVINAEGLPVQLFLTDYTLQSAFTALWPLLQAEVTAFPVAFQIITGFLMDTNSFQMLIPELYEKFGEAALMLTLEAVPGVIPQVQLTMGLQTTVTLNVTISVWSQGEWVSACSLQTAVALDINFLSEQLNLYVQVNALSMTELTQTSGIEVDVANVQTAFNSIITTYFEDINGLFHNTVRDRQERVSFIGIPWLHIEALELIQSAGYLQPGWQIRLS